MDEYSKVVVSGEVDSGKSTLIGRFLYEMDSLSKGAIEDIREVCQSLGRDFEFAYLLDSLEEERKDKLTIDTTQKFCKDRKGNGFLFIDVPGHIQLIRNMLCGSSYADEAIVVVDVKKRIEEGTKRHINVLKFLGIERIIFALNKMDLSGFKECAFKNTKEKLVEFSKRTGIQAQYFIPVSAKQGDNLIKRSKNMPWYKELSLVDALYASYTELKEKENDFYFPVQDVYYIEGENVLVGSIISGKIKKSEVVKIAPINKVSKIKKIKVFNKAVSSAKAKESIGLVLTEPYQFLRGQVIYKGSPPEVTNKFSSRIFCTRSLNVEKRLIFKCLTQQFSARIERVNKVFDINGLETTDVTGNLKETEAAEAIIAIEGEVVIKKSNHHHSLGRFVLQNISREICAVGVIL